MVQVALKRPNRRNRKWFRTQADYSAEELNFLDDASFWAALETTTHKELSHVIQKIVFFLDKMRLQKFARTSKARNFLWATFARKRWNLKFGFQTVNSVSTCMDAVYYTSRDLLIEPPKSRFLRLPRFCSDSRDQLTPSIRNGNQWRGRLLARSLRWNLLI